MNKPRTCIYSTSWLRIRHEADPRDAIGQARNNNNNNARIGSVFYSGGGEHQSYRVETRSPDGTVTGRYGYVDPRGVLRIVDYVADRRGYRYVRPQSFEF